MMHVLFALFSEAQAANPAGFGAARLLSGTPDFGSCINDDSACQQRFFGFLGVSMLEQGFAMQGRSLQLSPLLNRRGGWHVGGALHTFPFKPPRSNLSGKEENTSFSPVFPRITGGYSAANDGDGRSWSLGGSLLPPVPVGGASALLLGVDGGLAWGPAKGLRHGLELDLQGVRARAPITATEEQVENRDSFSNPDNLDPQQFEEVCGDDLDAGASGCIDTYTFLNTSLRWGLSHRFENGFTPGLKLGVTYVHERLQVKYDDTRWGVDAIQPSAHVALAWELGDHVFLGLGGSTALKQANQDPDEKAGFFGTIDGAAAWMF